MGDGIGTPSKLPTAVDLVRADCIAQRKVPRNVASCPDTYYLVLCGPKTGTSVSTTHSLASLLKKRIVLLFLRELSQGCFERETKLQGLFRLEMLPGRNAHKG